MIIDQSRKENFTIGGLAIGMLDMRYSLFPQKLIIAFLLFTLMIGLGFHAKAQTPAPDGQEIVIWSNDAPPNAIPVDKPEDFNGSRFLNVAHPRLFAYPLPPEKRNGVALLVAPGGGYAALDYHWLKTMQDFFSANGMTVFFLKYRIAPATKDPAKDALSDATRAIQIIRSRASEWGIDPKKIGMIGHSAGANLTLNAATHSVAGNPSATDPVLKVDSRLNFIVLCSTWRVDNLAQFPISKETIPPVIMFHARDDTTAPFADAEKLGAAFQSAGVPVDLHWIDKGGHMICSDLRPGKPGGDTGELTIAWLKKNGLWSEKH